jgi:signal transduction histidine kinase
MTRLGRWNLRGISGQIAALVIVSIVTLHAIITASFLVNRPDHPDPPARGGGGQGELATAMLLLGASPAADRPRLAADLARALPELDIQGLSPGTSPAAHVADSSALHRLHRHLGPSYRLVALADAQRIGVVLPDGEMISTRLPPETRHPPTLGSPWMMTLLFAVISVTLLGVWAARGLTAPLSTFAEAAENFSLDGADAPLPERGPEEIRAVAKALNRMRERITGLIDDRTRMLAAISHDLRTPITRMRLRSEFIEDDAQRGRMLADLNQMQSMLESVLSFLQNDRKPRAMTLVDLASALQLIADQFSDAGYKVRYVGPAHATAFARPDDLHRCITNLVENATRFGTETTIRLTLAADGTAIEVEDDGPGISEAQKQSMLKPFVRGDSARNMDDATGFGLGLSIAQAIVLAHGGRLSLLDRSPHGLLVRVVLPAGADERRAAA